MPSIASIPEEGSSLLDNQTTGSHHTTHINNHSSHLNHTNPQTSQKMASSKLSPPSQNVPPPQTISISAADLAEPSGLFMRYTVDQINEIEAKIRNDIERKREDLRQMVGERYRDIIQAADTIESMHHCTRDIVDSLSNLRVHYSQKVRPKAIQAGEAYVQHRIKVQDAQIDENSVEKSKSDEPPESKTSKQRSGSTTEMPVSSVTWKQAFGGEAGQRINAKEYLESTRKRKLFEIACNTRALIELSDVVHRAIEQNRLFQAAELCSLGEQCYKRLAKESTKTALLQTIPALARPLEKLQKDKQAVRRMALNIGVFLKMTDSKQGIHEN